MTRKTNLEDKILSLAEVEVFGTFIDVSHTVGRYGRTVHAAAHS